MTHLSRVIWSWQPSPSDLKSSHSVAIKQPSNNCRCGCRTLRTIGRVTGTKWDAGWYISTSWHPGLPPWWMGRGRRSGTRRGAVDHRKRQKVTTARGIWPQRESGGGNLWPLLHPACYNHIFISVPPGRFCKLVNLHSNLTCHDAILKSGTTQAPRTLSKYLNIWHPAPMHCNGKMQQFWATRCQTWFPQAHCLQKGPYFKDLFGILGPYWVLIYISGSLFSLF